MRPSELWNREGGGRELFRLALPLILSSSFMTLQVTIDRILLSQYSIDATAATMPAIALYYTPFILLQATAGYASTFIAQYVGAKRPERVGPVVWQALYFSVITGIAFLGFLPIAPFFMELGGASPSVQELETVYFRCLCFAALPALITASANAFFSGRGDSWTVLLVDSVGFVVNGVLSFAWINGKLGFPEWGIAGAGWATVIGTWCSAVTALLLFLRKSYRAEFHTLSGWRFDAKLFGRMMWFGMPNGLQWMFDVLAFTAFVFLMGWFGDVEAAASNIAFSINMIAVLPALGLGNAVCILVGQRLGEDRPELAERTTWTGFGVAWTYMSIVALAYFFAPQVFLYFFENKTDPKGPLVAAVIPKLLRFIAIYSLFDSMTLIFSFALRGAGDTRFVTKVMIVLSWLLMVLPTYFAWRERHPWGLYAAWTAATTYVVALAIVFLLRFLYGPWKTMRVIEPAVVPEAAQPALVAAGAE